MQGTSMHVGAWHTRRARSIDRLASDWDAVVPPDCHHLRAGFLRAAERGRVVRSPLYLLLEQGGQPVAVALLYDIDLDLTGAMPVEWRRYVRPVTAIAPAALTVPLRVCGSPVSSGGSGVWMAPSLSPSQRSEIIERVAQEMADSARWNQILLFKDVEEELTASMGSLEARGYLAAAMLPNMVMDVRWPDAAGYLASLRAHYRRWLRQDLRAGDELHWETLDDFADLASTATALYHNVLQRAEFKLETLTPGFFAALSAWEGARLLVARERPGGPVVGVNLLLFGQTTTVGAFVGLDYRLNERYRLYFNLMQRGLLLALDRGCRRYWLGQASYDFKSRLGASPVPLRNYVRHPLRPVQRLLRASRDYWAFNEEVPSHRHVFRDEHAEGAPAGKEQPLGHR
jgi:hypothetical protein